MRMNGFIGESLGHAFSHWTEVAPHAMLLGLEAKQASPHNTSEMECTRMFILTIIALNLATPCTTPSYRFTWQQRLSNLTGGGGRPCILSWRNQHFVERAAPINYMEFSTLRQLTMFEAILQMPAKIFMPANDL